MGGPRRSRLTPPGGVSEKTEAPGLRIPHRGRFKHLRLRTGRVSPSEPGSCRDQKLIRFFGSSLSRQRQLVCFWHFPGGYFLLKYSTVRSGQNGVAIFFVSVQMVSTSIPSGWTNSDGATPISLSS